MKIWMGYGYGWDYSMKYYLDEHYKGKAELNLEEITQRKIIKSIKDLDTRMKLLEPEIYISLRNFYLTIQS